MEFKILRQELSHRGGGIEIDLTPFGFGGEKMTAYQNYLGGGMLGKICNDCTIDNWENICIVGGYELLDIAEELRKYMHELTNPDEDEWETLSFEQNQELPSSAY